MSGLGQTRDTYLFLALHYQCCRIGEAAICQILRTGKTGLVGTGLQCGRQFLDPSRTIHLIFDLDILDIARYRYLLDRAFHLGQVVGHELHGVFRDEYEGVAGSRRKFGGSVRVRGLTVGIRPRDLGDIHIGGALLDSSQLII